MLCSQFEPALRGRRRYLARSGIVLIGLDEDLMRIRGLGKRGTSTVLNW